MWSSRTIHRRTEERGFVLATTLLVTTLLTVMLAASFLLVSAEQRTTDNSFGTARALALAQAGLQNYYSLNRALSDTSTYDSIHVALANGYADVVAKRVRPLGAASGSPQALFVVRSTAVATNPVMAGQVQGSRTIAQFAQLNPSHLPARAALVALNGALVTAGSGSGNPLNGDDLGSISPCVSPGSPAADTNAVSVPLVTQFSSPGYSAANPGNAPTNGSETFSTWQRLYDSTHVDWAGINSGSLIADYVIPPGAPATSPPWPTVGSNNYNVGFVGLDSLGNPRDVVVPSGQRRGVLVVTGNVRMADGAHWDGIVLAGGTVSGQTSGATWIAHGMVVTGLNIALGGAVHRDTLRRGYATVEWTWCYTQSSINSLNSLVPIKNGWADIWTTY